MDIKQEKIWKINGLHHKKNRKVSGVHIKRVTHIHQDYPQILKNDRVEDSVEPQQWETSNK